MPENALQKSCPHPRYRWEANPRTGIHTLRCTRCSHIRDTFEKRVEIFGD